MDLGGSRFEQNRVTGIFDAADLMAVDPWDYSARMSVQTWTVTCKHGLV